MIIFLIYLLLPKSNLNTHVEAVNMDLTNYKYDYYVQRNVVKIAGDVGTASYTFEGMPAVYDLKIAYVDEDDGNSTYTVEIKGKEVASWVADKNPTKDSIFIYSINDVKLDYGTQIQITGTRNQGEGARIAYLDITYSSGITLKSVLDYMFSYFMTNMPVASIFILLFVIFLFLIVNILFFILFHSRKKRLVKKLDSKLDSKISENNQDGGKTLSQATFNNSYDSDTLVTSENEYTVSGEKEISEDFSKKPINCSNGNDNSTGTSDQNSGKSTINSSCQTVDTPLIDKIKMYLDNNFSDANFSVQEMADNFNLSINYLSSYFKEQTDENIINYITYLRIEKAKHLLITTDIPIKNIAENSGYYNVSSFIRRFKQITGVTPGKYRENNLSN